MQQGVRVPDRGGDVIPKASKNGGGRTLPGGASRFHPDEIFEARKVLEVGAAGLADEAGSPMSGHEAKK